MFRQTRKFSFLYSELRNLQAVAAANDNVMTTTMMMMMMMMMMTTTTINNAWDLTLFPLF